MAELTPLSAAAERTHDREGIGGEERADQVSGASAEHVRITDALSTRSARPVDDIAARSGLSIATVQAALGTMQLEGAAAERAFGWVKVPTPRDSVRSTN